jgi:hypothetical protein
MVNIDEAAARRRRVRRGVLAVVLVGGAGLIAIGITFVHWAHDGAHHSLSGWQLFRRYGVTFDAWRDDVDLDFGDGDISGGVTGATTLVAGLALVVSAVLLACTFDPEARVDYGFVAYPARVATTVRILGGIAVALLAITAVSHVMIGFNVTALVSFLLALVAGAGVFGLAAPLGGT